MGRNRYIFAPPKECGALYDPYRKTIYFFKSVNATKRMIEYFIEEIEQNINHETLHYVIHKIAGKKAQYGLDYINRKVKKWDELVYQILY